MWTITGPFDRERGDVSQQKTKLLKNGEKYLLGRKERDLTVNHGKVSQDHAQFIVGGYTTEDVANPSSRSSLVLHNTKSKTMQIDRNGTRLMLNPNASHDLEDGDEITIVAGVQLIVKWQSICCFETVGKGRTPVSIDGCASLGINVVSSLHPAVTHHLTPTLNLTPELAASLLSAAHFVKPEWLQDILRSGVRPRGDPKSLEQEFVLPQESKHRPGYASSLPSALKKAQVWEPNEARLNMFRKCRFIFVGEKGREVSSEYQTVVKRGQGEYEVFTVDAGLPKWKKVLSKGMAWSSDKKGKLHLVADSSAMQVAVGKEDWEAFVAEANSVGLSFILHENILQAIAHADPFYFDSSSQVSPGEDSPIPDFIPNTHPEEPSIPPDHIPQSESSERASNGRRVTRASSQAAEPAAPEPEPQPPAPPPPRRFMSRRNRQRTPLSLLDDVPMVAEEDKSVTVSESTTPAPPVPGPSTGPPMTLAQLRASRQKRRAGGAAATIDLLGLESSQAAAESSTLGKYKSLFEESDPDRVAQAGVTHSQMPQSLTQSETQSGDRPQSGAAPAVLDIVMEEEEETQTGTSRTQASGLKRKADELGDVEMQELEDDPDADLPATTQSEKRSQKRRALESNAVQPSQAPGVSQPASGKGGKPASAKSVKQQPPSPAKGAAVGKPDTDEKFLKAVNSTKRGKKHEDEFDREFNKLRISKPELDRDQQEKDWAVLADFGNDGVRGNFMVVLELDVDRNTGAQRAQRAESSRAWEGKPDFKKFKKKSTARRRETVELLLSEENDHGIGPGYWKPQSQSQAPPVSEDLEFAGIKKTGTQRNKPSGGKGKAKAIVVAESDSDEGPTLPKRKGKAPTRSQKVPSTASRATRQSRSREPSQQPLFLPSDDDEARVNSQLQAIQEDDSMESSIAAGLRDEDAMSSTMRTNASQETAPRRTARATAQKRKVSVLADDDSDDATFKGFGNRKKRGRVA